MLYPKIKFKSFLKKNIIPNTFTKDNLTGKYYVNSSLDRTVTAYTNVNYGYDNFLIGKNWRDNNRILENFGYKI